jgi:putative acetyltransferase
VYRPAVYYFGTVIRAEAPADRADVHAVHECAFGRPDEARVVDEVRETPAFVPELSLVAEEDVGHVLLSYTKLEDRDVLLLGPIGVLPNRQRQGIGSALVVEGLRLAEARGEPLVLLEGSPAYYSRFGFRLAGELGIEAPPGAPAQYFQVRTLAAYTPELRGRVTYPPAFRE